MPATMQNRRRHRLEALLVGLRQGKPLTDEDIRYLLGLTDRGLLERLFQAAREVRAEFLGNMVFLYGFVYFSTFCRNDCTFCRYRRPNSAVQRYRKPTADIVSAAHLLAAEGVHLIDLTMGEDPWFLQAQPSGFEELAETVRHVKNETGLPVMISPGVLPRAALRQMAAAGADWYACYQETHNPVLFNALRPGQSYSARWQAKLDASGAGLLVEEGILCGVGETTDDIAESIMKMLALAADQVRVMSFVPQPGTPLAGASAPSCWQELVILAVMRLAFPDRLIPASLDVAGAAGLRPRLEAGANVITSCIVPDRGYTGVAQASLDIDSAARMPPNLMPLLEQLQLRPAAPGKFRDWMARRRQARRES